MNKKDQFVKKIVFRMLDVIEGHDQLSLKLKGILTV